MLLDVTQDSHGSLPSFSCTVQCYINYQYTKNISPNDENFRYPAICIKLLTQVDQWQKLLRLIVDLNNISLLKGRHGEGKLCLFAAY